MYKRKTTLRKKVSCEDQQEISFVAENFGHWTRKKKILIPTRADHITLIQANVINHSQECNRKKIDWWELLAPGGPIRGAASDGACMQREAARTRLFFRAPHHVGPTPALGFSVPGGRCSSNGPVLPGRDTTAVAGGRCNTSGVTSLFSTAI